MIKRIDYFSRHNVKKASVDSLVVRQLRAFLDANEPDLVYFLVNLWRTQGKAITYKELREAILNGELSTDYLEEWRQDYSNLVTEQMLPAWNAAIEAAAKEVEAKYPEWNFNPAHEAVRQWTEEHSAEFVTNSTQRQIEAVRAVVHRAATLQDMSVDQLARAIRPMVGLYKEQAVANMNYYQTLIENGVKEQKALDLSIRYGARQHRYRGYLIARQELAMAYNTGADQSVRQAQAAGYIGDTVKVASCAADERVCEICGKLDGTIIGMDEDFDIPNRGNYRFTKKHPPFHIGCRCGVEYREVSPPIFKTE